MNNFLKRCKIKKKLGEIDINHDIPDNTTSIE